MIKPQATCDPTTDQEIIQVPQDWQSVYPFSARFAGSETVGPGDLVMDLRAARFATSGLSQPSAKAGGSRFLMPDLSSFAPELRDGGTEGSYRYMMVQAATPQDQVALRKHLLDSGLTILDYLPNMAYLVRLPAAKAALLETMPAVYWAGDFVPAYRVDPELDYVIEASPEHWMEIRALFDRALYASSSDVESAAAASGATVRSVEAGDGEWIVKLEGQVQAARRLVRTPGCLWAERYVPFELHNNVARTSSYVATGRGSQSGPIMDVEKVWAMGIHGEGQIASASDTGLSTGNLATLHKDFGDQSDPNNPMRVKTTWALGRTNDWSDPAAAGDGHGTHTSGSILGNGFRSGSTPSTNTFPTTSYAGIAPKAQYDFQSVMNASGSLTGIPADLNNLFQPPYTDGARVHSNSWGSAVAGAYNTDSQNVDKFTWNNKDMVITFSAGNSGIDRSPADGVVDKNSIGSPGTAKNCITVGATEDYRPTFLYEYPQGTCNTPTWYWFDYVDYATAPISSDLMADNANGMGAFSSRGPVTDGRFKPELCAPGIAIVSTRTDQAQAWEQWGLCGIPTALQTYYIFMGGTSMANPLTAGSAVLVRQYYTDGWHPNNSGTTNGSANAPDGFDPSSALVKATLINGAWDMTPGQYGTGSTKEIPPGWDTGHDLPNNAEGYGRVDLMHSLFPGSGWADVPERKLEVHDVSPGLTTGNADTYTFNVTSSSNPLIVTLAWTDPYGATAAATELVNNLDLTVTAPDATVYYPNGLNKTSGVDNKNNIEQVKLTAPLLGTYTIKVNGTAVPGNAQSGTTTQPYALVISGVNGCTNSPNKVDVTPNGPLTLCPGTAQLLTANITGGTGPFSYQWTRDGVDIPSANGSTYSANDAGSHLYNCKVAGSGCSTFMIDTVSTQLTWQAAPTFAGIGSVTNPYNATCTLNLTWNAATAYCGGPITYNVYRSTSSGFIPSAPNRIASGISPTNYADSAGLVNGTTYYYVVRAVDGGSGVEDSNTVQQSGIPFGPLGATTIYSQDFESATGLAGWETGYFVGSAADWQGVQACSPTGSGTNIFRYGGTTCTGTYNTARIAFAAPGGTTGIAIPAGSTTVRLTFNHRWNFFTGTSPTRRDGATLWISNDNATFYTIPASAIVAGTGFTSTTSIASGCASRSTGNGRSAWTGTQATMVSSTLDLDAACTSAFGSGAAGKTLWIAFNVITGCTAAATNYGWFIDDVVITANTPAVCSNACPTITLSPATLPNATVGTAYTQLITASGGSSSYNFTVTSGSLPAGFNLASDGTLTGLATTTFSSTFTVTATIPGTTCTGSQGYTLTAVRPTIIFTAANPPGGTVGTSYSYTFVATGGISPYTYTYAGTLPTGLALSSAGVLSGIPTAAATFSGITVTATDYYGSQGSTAPLSITINCPTITVTSTPSPLPSGTVGTPYPGATFSANGGTSPYTYSISSGSVPGLTLDLNSGALSGTLTTNGTFNFTVTAVDHYGCSGSHNYAITTSYNLSFLDDLGRSSLCLNSTSGSYLWKILKGAGAGTSCTGTGQVTQTATLLTLTNAPGAAQRISLTYYKVAKSASGYCQCGAQYSTLVDGNTTNDPPCE